MDLQTLMHGELLRLIVARQITCPRTGEVLDVRTCVVLLDADGDPAAVLSQKGWQEIAQDTAILANLGVKGLAVDLATVRQ